MKATYRRPSGFIDPSHFESEVNILGYAFGRHRDAAGYGRDGETMLAIFSSADGLGYAPLHHFWLSPPSNGDK